MDTRESVSKGHKHAECAAPLIGEWYFCTLVNFNKIVGKQKMIEALTPYFKEHGAWGWSKIKDHLSSCRTSHERMAHMVKFGTCVAGFPNSVSITSKGVVYRIYSCQNVKGDPIFCDVHDLLGKALINSIDEDYDHNYVKRMNQGSSHCLGVIVKKDQSSELDSYGEAIETIAEPTFSEQEMVLFSEQFASQIWILAVSAFVDEAGANKTLSSMLPIMRSSGMTHGYRYAATIGSDKDGFENIIPLISYFSTVLDQHISFSDTGNCIRCVVNACPFQDSTDEVCLMIDTFMEGLCQSVDRDLILTTERERIGRRQICTWHISKKR
jgi:hypothetical protein